MPGSAITADGRPAVMTQQNGLTNGACGSLSFCFLRASRRSKFGIKNAPRFGAAWFFQSVTALYTDGTSNLASILPNSRSFSS